MTCHLGMALISLDANWMTEAHANHSACLQEATEDTTGAGDAFVGTVLFGITNNMSHEEILQLAAVVAACKCTALGARPGLPYAEDISPALLNA